MHRTTSVGKPWRPGARGKRSRRAWECRRRAQAESGAAPREDAAGGIRALRGRAPAARRQGEAGDVRIPRLHAHLREEEEWAVHGGEADDPEEGASEAERGEGRASATVARSDPSSGYMAASGRGWARPLLRRAHAPAPRPGRAPGRQGLPQRSTFPKNGTVRARGPARAIRSHGSPAAAASAGS